MSISLLSEALDIAEYAVGGGGGKGKSGGCWKRDNWVWQGRQTPRVLYHGEIENDRSLRESMSAQRL